MYHIPLLPRLGDHRRVVGDRDGVTRKLDFGHSRTTALREVVTARTHLCTLKPDAQSGEVGRKSQPDMRSYWYLTAAWRGEESVFLKDVASGRTNRLQCIGRTYYALTEFGVFKKMRTKSWVSMEWEWIWRR